MLQAEAPTIGNVVITLQKINNLYDQSDFLLWQVNVIAQKVILLFKHLLYFKINETYRQAK